MINRRRAIQLMALSLASFAPITQRRVAAAGSVGERVLVIGAGIAGLAAAQSLKRTGFQVTVLEARDRVGGRIWTSREWRKSPLDMGASWIHESRGNPLTVLARRSGVRTRATNYDNAWAYWATGAELTGADERRLEQLSQWLEGVTRSVAARGDRSLEAAIAERLADYSGSDLMMLGFLINTEIEHEYAADASALSPQSLSFGEGFSGSDLLFPGGYASLIRPLQRGLSIKTGCRVDAVRQNGVGVTVETTVGVFQADRVIVTVPLGVLQKGSIRFMPALPEAKQAAMAELGMGVLNKAYLRFPKAFWPKTPELFHYISDPPGQWAEWLNVSHYSGRPILLGFNAGTFGREIEAWSDREQVASALDVLRKLFGNAIPEPTGWQLTRWGSDPYSFGAYSYMRPGSGASSYEGLAAPVDNRLFFAGEATSAAYSATTHGAYLSGLRCADAIRRV
jgi:monoamine oxidase